MRSLRLKIGFGYFVLILIVLATSVFALLKFVQLRNQVAPILRNTYQSTLAAENLLRSLDDQEHALLSAVIDDPELYRTYFNESRDIFISWLVKVKESVSVPFQNALIDSIIATDSIYNQAADQLFVYLIEKNNRRLGLKYQKYVVRPIAERLRNQCSQLLEANQTSMIMAEKRIYQNTQEAIISMLFTALASIVLSIWTGIRFTRTVIIPAEKLTETVRKIGQGNLNQKIDVLTDDEIGVLSSEFNKMTERLRKYEEMNVHQILAEKRKSETIVASISEPVIVTDGYNRLVLVNEAAKLLLNISLDWAGKYVNEVITQQEVCSFFEESLYDEGNFTNKSKDFLFSLQKDDAILYYRPHQTKIYDEEKKLQFVVTLFADVTRFKTLEKMKTDFIATVSHELRTPLTSLAMGIDILSKEITGPLTKKQKELIASAESDIERLRKLVKDLLDLSKFEAGKSELQKEFCNFSQVVEAASRALRLQFDEKGISFTTSVPSTLPPVFIDAEKITWVLTNLLNNALRYTQTGGKVSLTVELQNQNLLVCVQDTGQGIPEEYHELIFDKFVQVKPATETNPGSVGLGLAIAREIIESHKGKIWVKSKVGVGSTFYFTIPING